MKKKNLEKIKGGEHFKVYLPLKFELKCFDVLNTDESIYDDDSKESVIEDIKYEVDSKSNNKSNNYNDSKKFNWDDTYLSVYSLSRYNKFRYNSSI